MKRYHVSKNLFNKLTFPFSEDTTIVYTPLEVGYGTFTLSTNLPADSSGTRDVFLLAGNVTVGAQSAVNGVAEGVPRTVTANNRYITIATRYNSIREKPSDYDYMLNTGETALPYEPYGNEWQTKSPPRYETATDVVTSLPVTVYGDGETDISLLMKGNTQTSGTPSPQNPVTINGTGNKTANLLSRDTGVNGYLDDEGNFITPHANLYTSDYIVIPTGAEYLTQSFDSTSGMVSPAMCFYDSTKTFISGEPFEGMLIKTFRVPPNAYYLRTCYRSTFPWVMLNVGDTALPFEPYGYKISIVNDSSPLTPIYVSQPLMKIATTSDNVNSSDTVTYNIRKLVMDRNISITDSGTSGNYHRYSIRLDGCSNRGSEFSTDVITTHYRIQTGWGNGNAYLYSEFLFISLLDSEYPNSSALKSFFTAQYDAGTPVTVWYILATPTTESVTAPSIPTTDGTVTIDVDTTVKPSELDLTYHGWHEHEPLKYVWQNLSPKASFTNNSTDSRDFFKPQIRTRYENVEQQVINFDNITATGKVELSFTINTENDYLRFQHSGATRNIIIFEMDGLSEGQYTLSFTVGGYNPSTAGGLSLSDMELKTISGQWV